MIESTVIIKIETDKEIPAERSSTLFKGIANRRYVRRADVSRFSVTVTVVPEDIILPITIDMVRRGIEKEVQLALSDGIFRVDAWDDEFDGFKLVDHFPDRVEAEKYIYKNFQMTPVLLAKISGEPERTELIFDGEVYERTRETSR
ncbi:MAG: hypothetical protein RLP44_09545 [Aggregatilineales bacterium]